MNIPILQQAYLNIPPAGLNAGAVLHYDGWFDEAKNWRKRPGLKALTTGLSAIDGVFWWADKSKLIVVAGGRIYQTSTPGGALTEISTAAIRLAVNAPVTFVSGGRRIYMANGDKIVHWDGVSAAAEQFSGQPAATHVTWLNGHVICNDLTDGVARFTDYLGTRSSTTPTWNTEYFTPEGNPDELSAIAVGWAEILLAGPRSIEIWQDTGAEGVPFERVSGAYIERGLSARYSLVGADNTWFFLDHERKIVRLEGRTPKIASLAYERWLQNLSAVSDARGFMLDHFYVLTFTQADVTLVYDVVSGQLAQWSWTNPASGLRGRYLGQCATYCPNHGVWVVGGRDGTLYASHKNLVTDNGDAIHSRLTGASLNLGSGSIKCASALTVRMQLGQPDEEGGKLPLGLAVDRLVQDGDGLYIRWRDDGGLWTNYAPVLHGPDEELGVQTRIQPLGSYRTRQYDLVHSALRPLCLAVLDEDVEVGRV